MKLIDRFIEEAKRLNKRVVFPEGTDERIISAAYQLKKEKIAQPVLIGKREEIENVAEKINIDVSEIEIINPEEADYFDQLVNLYMENRKNISRRVAEKLVRRPLIFGGMLVSSGKVSTMVAGAVNTTANVIQSAALTVGYLPEVSSSSSFFIMSLPDGRVFFYADCAVNINPDENQLAEIGYSTALNYKKLMKDTPRVAFLSFSTKGSASHPMVEKVQKAVKIAREKYKNFLFDGEFQADTAIVENVAKRKVKEPSDVAGKANVLIFPDLNAGNIAYKLTQYLAGADAYGPILQGFAKPVSDLSRGAKVKDIIGTVVITSLQT